MIKTVSLETAKLLKEAGFRPDTEFKWIHFRSYSQGDGTFKPQWAIRDRVGTKYDSFETIGAPTTDELLEELMPGLMIRKQFSLGYVVWHPNIMNGKFFVSDDLCDALAQMWLYLKKEGLLNERT